MRIFVNIIVIISFSLLAFACGKDEDAIATEKTKIISYFTNQLKIEEGDYDAMGGVFRYVGNADRAGYEQAAEAQTGDSVSFYYSVHLLNTNATVLQQPLIYTNKKYLIDELKAKGLTGQWTSDPYKAKLGSSPLAKGLQRGLTGAREQDSLLLFMTSDMGYGKQEMFNVPSNSSLLFIIDLISVKKQ